MSDIAEIVRAVASEFAQQTKQTNDRIDANSAQTNHALQQMSGSMQIMAKSVQKTSEQLVRYEERQIATSDRAERIEVTQRDQGLEIKNLKKETEFKYLALVKDLTDKHQTLRDEVKDNSFVRKAITWATAALILAMLGGGALFSSLTGRTPPP